jgi:hypothetical protein
MRWPKGLNLRAKAWMVLSQWEVWQQVNSKSARPKISAAQDYDIPTLPIDRNACFYGIAAFKVDLWTGGSSHQ